MNTNSRIVTSVSTLWVLMLFSTPAYGYIDPGTGSMLIQGLIAAIAAVSVSVGLFWRRIRSFLDRILDRDRSE